MWVHLTSVYVITLVALKVSLLAAVCADCFSIASASVVVLIHMWVHLASVYVITLVALKVSLYRLHAVPCADISL
jgi:hypothetical protein